MQSEQCSCFCVGQQWFKVCWHKIGGSVENSRAVVRVVRTRVRFVSTFDFGPSCSQEKKPVRTRGKLDPKGAGRDGRGMVLPQAAKTLNWVGSCQT